MSTRVNLERLHRGRVVARESKTRENERTYFRACRLNRAAGKRGIRDASLTTLLLRVRHSARPPQLVQLLHFDVHQSSRRLCLREHLPPVERAFERRALQFGQGLGLHRQKIVYNLLVRVGEGFLLDVNGTIRVLLVSSRRVARLRETYIDINHGQRDATSRANYPREEFPQD